MRLMVDEEEDAPKHAPVFPVGMFCPINTDTCRPPKFPICRYCKNPMDAVVTDPKAAYWCGKLRLHDQWDRTMSFISDFSDQTGLPCFRKNCCFIACWETLANGPAEDRKKVPVPFKYPVKMMASLPSELRGVSVIQRYLDFQVSHKRKTGKVWEPTKKQLRHHLAVMRIHMPWISKEDRARVQEYLC